MFLSVPTLSAEGDPEDQVFQVLALESRSVIVATFTAPDDIPERGLYTISAQPYERWRAGNPVMRVGPRACEEVFAIEDPLLVDLLDLVGGATDRRRWLKWETRQSDVEGCVSLVAPTPLRPQASLSSPTIPVLCLMDALDQAGVAGVERRVVHDSVGVKEYDCRQAVAKRAYLQCVLAFGDLQAAGVGPFPSGQPNSFYALILRERKPVPLALGSAEYNKRLAVASGELPELAALGDALAPSDVAAPAALQALRSAAAATASDDDSSNAIDDGISAPAESAQQSAGESSDELAVDRGDEPAVQRHRAPPGLPADVLGQPLRRIPGRKGGGWSYHARVQVACWNPLHEGCSKSRSVALDVETHGPQACVFYLGAWLRAADGMSAATHKSYKPTAQQVRDFARECAHE